MKIKELIAFLMITLLATLTQPAFAEAENPPAVNPFEAAESSESVRIGGYRTEPVGFDYDNATIKYTGESVSLTFRFVGTGSDTEVGVMFFLDGVLQPHSASNDPDGALRPMTRVRFGAEDSEEVAFTFLPVTGKKGDSLGLQMTSIFFPDFVPDDPQGSFAVFHSPLSYIPLQLDMETDSTALNRSFALDCAEETIPDDVRERNTFPENPTGEFRSPRFDFFVDGDRFANEPVYTDGKETHEFLLDGYGDLEADYRATFFLDNRPLEIAGGDNAIIHVPYGKMIRCKVPLTLPAVRPISPLTAALVPIGDSYLSEEAQSVLTRPIKIVLKENGK